MERDNQNRELDDFLSDLHRLLDDMEGGSAPAQQAAEQDADRILDDLELPQTPEEAPVSPEETPAEPSELEELNFADAEPLPGEALPEEAEAIDVDDLLARVDASTGVLPEVTPEMLEQPEPAEPEAPAEPEPPVPPVTKSSSPKDKARELVSWTQKQRVPRHVAKLQKNQQQAYDEWVKQQELNGPDAPPPDNLDIPEEVLTPTRKKHHFLRNFLILLVVLALGLSAAAAFALPSQPVGSDKAGAHREGVSTILLLGTDASGARTDAVMLLTVDEPAGKLSLVSIPRDTLVEGKYEVPKLGNVFGAEGGGRDGTDMVKIRLSQCIGFMPDGYILVQLHDFEALVDQLGGVAFDVPRDMVYEDHSQDLKINLKKGYQTLDGEDALALMRFRSGYPDDDLGRIQVQRDFLAALLAQSVDAGTILRLPQLMNTVLRSMETDLSAGNLLWLARAVLTADRTHIQTAALPGSSVTLDGLSYFVPDPALTAQTVNTYCNPYDRDITPEDLEIRTN